MMTALGHTYPQDERRNLPHRNLPHRNLPRPVPLDTDPLFPLSELLDGERPRLEKSLEEGEGAMPQPYRRLLVHDSDMTSTLERWHHEPARLEELRRERRDMELWREVLLLGTRSERVMEYGAIRIDLSAFDSDPRWAILAEHRVVYRSRPSRFFALRSTDRLQSLLGLDAPTTLYGRQNVLLGEKGTLAEVVEILPTQG
jgi:hypothetical protein